MNKNKYAAALSGRRLSRRSVTKALAGAGLGAVTFGLTRPILADEALTVDDVIGASGDVNVLGSQVYEVPGAYPAGIDVNYAYNVTNEEIITKTSQEGTFDLVKIYQGQIDQLRKLDRIVPINVDLIPNWDMVGSFFRDSDVIRRDGEIYAIPYHWGHSYTEYNADEVDPPQSFEDLMDPKLAKKVIVPDDPYAVITTFAIFAGFDRPNNLTPDQFAQTIELMNSFKPQLLTIHAYGEEAALFGRGDAWVGFPEFSSSVVAAREAGATNMQFNTLGAWSYVDCLMIVRGAENLAAAYAYINSAISTDGQLASTAHSLAFPVNDLAIGALPEALQYESSDDVLARAPLLPGVTVEEDTGDVPFQEWVKAWEQFKAS